MTVQIVAARRSLTSSAVCRILGRCALAVIGASFAAVSISTFGADLATGSSQSVTGPSRTMGVAHQPITVQPSAPLDAKLDHLAAHARVIDRLYEELIRWTPPSCSLTLTSASIAGRC
jgi:hypothetical protein